ncbi:MAG TPA: O-methyltransferase [Vicinamibacterales bacterium]|jgi:predicted O-methyltransferase YrrM|nr:O-methyltransferase [Vicinamibacterales bacterium]
MSDPVWSDVDSFFEQALHAREPLLDDVLARSDAAGLPSISVTSLQGRFLQMLAASLGARSILEVGTLGGFSTIYLARALPSGGRLVTIEAEPRHAAVARESFARAGLAGRIELLEGKGLDVLPRLVGARFDFTFIDADKPNTPAYFDWAVRLSRPGSLIVVDNVVRDGELADGASTDASVRAMRAVCERVGRDSGVMGTALQTVGLKGYDGFLIARVVAGV